MCIVMQILFVLLGVLVGDAEVCVVVVFFFFSSRRRHTRCSRDWSSDVCSSDLIAMALFLDQDKDSPRIDVEALLDFIQIGIVFFFIFVEFYFLPAQRLDEHTAFLRELRVENLEDVMVAALAAFRALTARKQHLRTLYTGLAVFVTFLMVSPAIAPYLPIFRPAPTGTLRDLLWTLPFLAGALWASEWKPSRDEGSGLKVRRKGSGELLVTNGTLALAPLIILFQVAQLEQEWRLLRFTLLGVSILCYEIGRASCRERV